MKKLFSLLAFTFALVTVALCNNIDATAVLHGITAFLTPHNLHHGILAGVPVVGVFDTNRSRAAYQKIQRVTSLLQQMTGNTLITNEDFFRSEQNITAGTTQYSFPTWQKVMDGNRLVYPLSQGVADKDLYIGISAGLFIDNRASVSGTTSSTDVQLNSYPNYTAFNSVTTTFADLFTIYNSLMTITVDRTVYIPRISTSRFYKVPQTQQASSQNLSQFSINESMIDFDPYFCFSGQNTNYLQLNITTNNASFNPSASSGVNVMTFFSKGVTVQSGADFIGAYTQGDAWFEAQGFGVDPAGNLLKGGQRVAPARV